MRDMSLRICVINQKGGSGKSSLSFHLSGEFARIGLRVLVIDCDPQGSLSQGFFGSALIESLEVADTLACLFGEDTACVAHALSPMLTSVPGISVLPTNLHLACHNTPQPETSGLLQHTLRSFVDTLDGFDVVLFDCPPNLYQCTWNALLAATHVIIPVPPEDFGTQGLRAVQQAVHNARLLNPELRLLGHLVTRQDRRLLIHRAYEQKLRQLYGESVLGTVLPEASAFKVAVASRQPVSQFCQRSRASQSIVQLAGEILERTARIQHEHRTVA